MNTAIANRVAAANDKAQYDEYAKQSDRTEDYT